MAYLIAYVCALVVFGAIDGAWLSFMGPIVYRPALADILAPNLRLAPAILFYLSYPIGIVYFATIPGWRAGLATSAFFPALLFGALAYATYDLTNYATLRHWTLQITTLDVVYGALASGIASLAAYAVVRAAASTLFVP